MASEYRKQLEEWLASLYIDGGCILDIGGSANPVLKRLGSVKYSEYKILDSQDEKDKHDKWSEPDVVADIQYRNENQTILSQCPSDWKERFDTIFMLEVAEYFTSPVLVFDNIGYLLKSSGVIYASFPSIYPVHGPREVDSLRYTKRGIVRILSDSFWDYSIEQVVPRVATKGREHLANFYGAEGMRAIKDEEIYNIGYMMKIRKI